MNIYGIDFTSSPKTGKPITCLHCTLDEDLLVAGELQEWFSLSDFEAGLARPGPWVTGADFPFAQSRQFIENMGWPGSWKAYTQHVSTLTRPVFRAQLDDYRSRREPGDKEHRRVCDIAAGSISPQKLYGTPVGLMFFEGAPRLLRSGVSIPGLHKGDPDRIVVEAYPGILARSIIGRRPYKQDTKNKQTALQREARNDLMRAITNGSIYDAYNIRVRADSALADDPSGDQLDALLCCIQAAWAWRQKNQRFGIPTDVDPLEGWIVDPHLSHAD